LLIEATATTLHARAVRPDGTQIDEFEIAR
jgi:hypothetical protein